MQAARRPTEGIHGERVRPQLSPVRAEPRLRLPIGAIIGWWWCLCSLRLPHSPSKKIQLLPSHDHPGGWRYGGPSAIGRLGAAAIIALCWPCKAGNAIGHGWKQSEDLSGRGDFFRLASPNLACPW